MANSFITIPLARADASRIVDALRNHAKTLITQGRLTEAAVVNHLATNIEIEIWESKPKS